MKGESIICLAKEWDEDPTSCNHVFEQLARHNRMLWVNSIATRTPSLVSAHDWRRIVRKLRRLLGGLRQVGPSAWLYQPLFIPLPFSEPAKKINRRLLRWLLRRQARRLGMRRPQLWMFQPNGAYLVGQLEEALVVYYCTDEWSQFAHLDGEKVAALERELLEKADVCFATSEPLAESKRRYNRNTFLALHGVDHELFSRALDPETPAPPEVAGLPRPVLGFFGSIRDHIDFPLIVKMAERHPEWSVVLIGKIQTNVDELRARSNVYLLGRRRYETLPEYCKAFDVGFIPYVNNEFVRHVNPVKLRQYLSAGVPVVSTEMSEVRRYGYLVSVARNHDEFIAQIEQALREDTPAKRRERSDAMRTETWEAKVAQISAQVMEIKASKAMRSCEPFAEAGRSPVA